MTFDEACRAVVRAAKGAKPGHGLQYAAAYAQAGIGMTGEERRVQALYILSNLTTWRGEEAQQVKAVLREASKKVGG
jgi:hypothetical protein